MGHSFSILVAEPNLLVREKIACVLARHGRVWCVTQVGGRDELIRGVANIQPDFILADLSILKDPKVVALIRRSMKSSRIFALVESETQPYIDAARRLQLDGVIGKGQVVESMGQKMKELSSLPEDSNG